MPDVRLVDLEVIKRFSLAVRQEYADAEELLDVLEADQEQLRALMKPPKAKKRSSRSGGARRTTRSGSRSGAKSGSRSKSGAKGTRS